VSSENPPNALFNEVGGTKEEGPHGLRARRQGSTLTNKNASGKRQGIGVPAVSTFKTYGEVSGPKVTDIIEWPKKPERPLTQIHR
jgi:hypothetical protein